MNEELAPNTEWMKVMITSGESDERGYPVLSSTEPIHKAHIIIHNGMLVKCRKCQIAKPELVWRWKGEVL